MRDRARRALAIAGLASVVPACGAGAPDGASCPIPLPADCEPLYEPTFEEIHRRTLARSCALAGCHGDGTAQGGLDLEEIDAAWSDLVEGGRVLPGDPGCSELVLRLHGAGVPLMPPGRALSAQELCTVQLWIEQGASR